MAELYFCSRQRAEDAPNARNSVRLGVAGTLALAMVVSFVNPAHATDGYFSEGVSTINQGIGGASIAYPRDTLAIATNPAWLFAVGNRVDLGIEYFSPDRGASITGNAFEPDQSFSANGSTNFLPSVGYSHLVTPDFALAVALYGNGGFNTSYGTNPYGRFGATGNAGVDLDRVFVSPTAAYQFAPGQSIGLSVDVAYVRRGSGSRLALPGIRIATGAFALEGAHLTFRAFSCPGFWVGRGRLGVPAQQPVRDHAILGRSNQPLQLP